MRQVVRYLPWVGLAVFLVASSCGGNKTGFGSDGGGDDSGTSDALDDTHVGFADSSVQDAPGCTTCSGDLHEVITCGDNPTVVQTCTGDQGCGPGGCTNACDAAAASKSSIGCDYYAIPPDAWTHKSCFAAFVTNNWSSDMKVSLVWKGNTIDALPYTYLPQGKGTNITYQKVPSSGIPQNSMGIVFINQMTFSDVYHVPCPAGTSAAIENEDVALSGTSIGNAVEIKTTVPAVVYDVYPYGGAASYMSSATLLLPTTAWDTNFVATTMAETPATTPGIDFVASMDGTQVTLLPTENITAANGVAGATKGSPVTYNLNKGQTLRLMQAPDGSGNDLSGTIVQSNNPIGAWGEHFCMYLTTSPPSWRVVGAVDGTTLTYDPPVSGAPTTLKEGQMVEFAGPNAFHVQAQDDQHPFYIAAHRPGGDCDAAHQEIPPIKALGYDYVAVTNETTDYGSGGPETVNVIPPAQFLSSYIFFTDPTYGNTDLALVRVKSNGVFNDVTLDCLNTPISGWQPVGSSGQYQYVHVDLQKNSADVGNCSNGLHTIKSSTPFGITVWGYQSAVSYAYPAGASVKPINTVVVPPVPH